MTTTLLAAVGLGLGLLYSLACLVSPAFASESVRLQPDPDRPGGYAEFRATFGGVFGGLHLFALIALYTAPAMAAAYAAGVVACGWAGAMIGRLAAVSLDGDKVRNTQLNLKLALFEFVMALAIGAPLLQLWLAT